MPVLVLTARGSWTEKVRGIDSGADDYLTKPFQMEELLARLRALIRRSSGQLTPELRCGAVVLDPRTSQVTLDGQPVKLTSHELRVLSYLMHHRGRVVSQSELTEHIYAQTFDRLRRMFRARGCTAEEAADYLDRMVLSFIANQGRWDLTDPAQVATLVRTELLAGVVDTEPV